MGAWGAGSFENDDAADFLGDVLENGDISLLREVFDNVLTSTEYVESPDACQAIVAAEIIAAALGRPTLAAQQVQELAALLPTIRPDIDAGLVAQAADALARILEPNSELLELWEESESLLEWQALMQELRLQLRA